MTQSQAVKYWFKSAEQNIKVAEDNFKLKHYDWCLFLWQLALEKTIKAIISSQGKTPPIVHNLSYLCHYSKIKVDKETELKLKEISSFNLEARYDDYKFNFYKKANKEFSIKWVNICKEIHQWLKKNI